MSDFGGLDACLRSKNGRKAKRGEAPKLINIPRNWLHQALRYMDNGERISRLFVEFIEFVVVFFAMNVVAGWNQLVSLSLSLIVVHSWNWVTNGLFWSVMIFSFPTLRNPGAHATVLYLNQMRKRLLDSESISGVAIYGSVSRGAWHDRSDIDIRFLRRPGMKALLVSVWITMRERFIALLFKQPMDLYLADDIDFLKKMRSDERPLFTLCRDERLQLLYPDCSEREVSMRDLVSEKPKDCMVTAS